VQELDRLHDEAGALRGNDPGLGRRRIALVQRIGDLAFPDYLTTKNAVKPFYSRAYLVRATEPALRQAIQAAVEKRLHALTRKGLRAAVEDPVAEVRVDAVRGLKTLGDREAVEVVAGRLEFESDWIVRLEIAEYLGKVGTRTGVKTLLPLLDDPDANVRRKARQALTRIAGRDLGWRRAAWADWARSKDPGIDLGPAAGEAAPEAASAP
jgi:HEAT repeat protein